VVADRAGVAHGASVSSVQREIAPADQAGVVGSRRLGNVRLVKATDSPLTASLTELLLRSFGPRQVLAEELQGVEGVEKAFLFGSWAARYAGEAGQSPADLDLLVIGAPDRDELDDAAQRAEGRLAREVNVTIRSPDWWRAGTDGFHIDVTRRPLVPIFGVRKMRAPRRDLNPHIRAVPNSVLECAGWGKSPVWGSHADGS
jgi:predicted nucleotidyltransferase